MSDIEDQDNVMGNEEELFGPSAEPIAPLSPLAADVVNGPRQDGLLTDLHGGEGAADEAEDTGGQKKKRKVNRASLNVERLTGQNGIMKLPKIMEDVKFKGSKGHEGQDLNLLLGKLEHWAHILMPRRQFVDVVEGIEFLGTRKIVKLHADGVKRGQIYPGQDNVVPDGDDGEQMDGNQNQNRPTENEPNQNKTNQNQSAQNGSAQNPFSNASINTGKVESLIKDDINALLEEDFGDLDFS